VKLAVPLFPSTEWFEAVIDVFNSDELKTTAGGGTCDAIVGIISGESLFQLRFEGIECVSVDTLEDEDQLGMTDFYIELHPEDWKDKLAPTVYEVLATSNTLKKMYSEQVKDIEKGVISVELGEENLRNIATNYQTIKALLFQPR